MKLAGCIITDSEERILLLHRNTERYCQWEVPGGKIEEGETPEQTATREVKEELGVGVEVIRKLGRVAFHEADEPMAYTWFLADIESGEPAIMEPETFDDLRYISLDEMRKLQLSVGAWNFLGMLADKGIKL